MLPFIPRDAKFVLEVGCGSGTFIRQLRGSMTAEFWGIEFDATAAQAAKLVFDQVMVGDITKLQADLPKAHFDCIIFNDVLEHLVEPETLLVALRENLSPKGVIVASVPNVRYIKNLVNLLVRRDWRYENDGILDRTHLRFFTQKSLLRMIEASGYEVLTCKGVNPTRFAVPFALLNAITLGSASDTRYLNFACVFKPR